MKKSLAYKLAQFAILNGCLENHEKLQVLRVLIDAEDLARFTEQEEEKEKNDA